MGLGIQQVDYDGEITGTFEMFLDDSSTSVEVQSLKKTKDGIILNPQPHDNPNDPLNWPIWRRDLSLFTLGVHSFIVGGQTSFLAAGLTAMAAEFSVSSTTISYLVGGFMLALGFGALFASPTARLFGKRFVYILGIVIFLAGSLWAATSQSLGSLMGARVLMGIGCSPIESLPSSTIAEIYFAHERAYRVGIYTLLLLGGKNLLPMFTAFIFQDLDRHWLFWINSIIIGANCILHILFVPETFWDRPPTPDKKSLEETKLARKALIRKQSGHPDFKHPNSFADLYHHASDTNIDELTSARSPPAEIDTSLDTTADESQFPEKSHDKRSFVQELQLWNGRHTKDQWWKVFLRPFVLYCYPHVLFASLLYAFAVVWLIMISELVSNLFTSSPYNYSKLTVGLFFISPFVGGSLGSMLAGKVSDKLVRYLVSKNGGIYEPELRLWMVIPSIVTTCIGLMGFGWSAYVQDMWAGPVILWGVLAFGSSFSSTTSITFALDSYKMFAAETLVCLNLMKNVFGFCFSLFNVEFNDDEGSKNAFVVFGCIEIFIGLLAIPLYIYGKRIRRYFDVKEPMKWTYN